MLKRKTALAALAMAGAVWGGSTQIAQAQEICNLEMAKRTLEPVDLCECKIVTSQMLRYIQRQDEFLSILADVTQECPAFADALNALPTATTIVERILRRDKEDGSSVKLPTSGPGKPKTKPDKKPKDKPDPDPGENPDPDEKPDPGETPETGENPDPGENPESGGSGDNPGGGEGGDKPGDSPSPEGCGGGSGDGGGSNAKAESGEGCD